MEVVLKMYCRKCGKELDDEAVVCTGCGVAVKPAKSAAKPKTVEAATEKKTASCESIVGFALALVAVLLAGGFFIVSAVTIQPDDWYDYIYGMGIVYFAFVFVAIGVAVSVMYSIFGLSKAMKNPEQTKSFSVAGLIVASASFVCTFVQLLILVC